MPEAAVDVHGDQRSGEDEVSASAESRQRFRVDAVSKPSSPDFSPYCELRSGVASRLSSHPVPDCL